MPAGASGPSRPKESIFGLAPGDYFVVAVDDLEVEAARDPDTLEQLSRGATRVTIADGDPVEINLRRIKLTREQ